MTLTRNFLFCHFVSIILASEDYYQDEYYEEEDLASLLAETTGEKREEEFGLKSENPASNYGTESRPEVNLHKEETFELEMEMSVLLRMLVAAFAFALGIAATLVIFVSLFTICNLVH